MKKSARLQDIEDLFRATTMQDVLVLSFTATRKYKVNFGYKTENHVLQDEYEVKINGASEYLAGLHEDFLVLSHRDLVTLATTNNWLSDSYCQTTLSMKHSVGCIPLGLKLLAWKLSGIKSRIQQEPIRVLSAKANRVFEVSF